MEARNIDKNKPVLNLTLVLHRIYTYKFTPWVIPACREVCLPEAVLFTCVASCTSQGLWKQIYPAHLLPATLCSCCGSVQVTQLIPTIGFIIKITKWFCELAEFFKSSAELSCSSSPCPRRAPWPGVTVPSPGWNRPHLLAYLSQIPLLGSSLPCRELLAPPLYIKACLTFPVKVLRKDLDGFCSRKCLKR